MRKLYLILAAAIVIYAGDILVHAASQYNWGTSTGGAWSTPDDSSTVANQVLQVGSSGGSRVVANTNVTLPGTLAVTGASTFSSSATISGSLTFPPSTALTLSQLQSLTPTTTGQVVFCTNCVNTLLVIATGTTAGQWAGVFASTGSVPAALK